MTKNKKSQKPHHLRVRKPKRKSLSLQAREYADRQHNIRHIYKDGPHTFMCFFEGDDAVLTDCLTVLMSWLNEDNFFRPCRQAIVHFGAITAYAPFEGYSLIRLGESFCYSIGSKKRKCFIDKYSIYLKIQGLEWPL
jgi:hypothetical protein